MTVSPDKLQKYFKCFYFLSCDFICIISICIMNRQRKLCREVFSSLACTARPSTAAGTGTTHSTFRMLHPYLNWV